MTTTLRTQTNGDDAAARARSASRPPATPVRRRWGRIGAGLAAAVLGGWMFAALYLSAGDKVDVVVIADDVPRLHTIERSDLRVAQLSESTEVETVSGNRLDEFVGRVAAGDLARGSPLNEAQVLPAGEQLIGAGEAVVGVLVGPADAPQDSLRRGTPLLVVVRPAPTSTEGPNELEAWVWAVSGNESSTREVAVEVVVPSDRAGQISAAAAERRVSIVALGG